MARPASQINVAEIVEAIDGPIVEEPTLTEGLAPHSARKLAHELSDIGRHAYERLASLRLVDMQGSPNKRLAKVVS